LCRQAGSGAVAPAYEEHPNHNKTRPSHKPIFLDVSKSKIPNMAQPFMAALFGFAYACGTGTLACVLGLDFAFSVIPTEAARLLLPRCFSARRAA